MKRKQYKINIIREGIEDKFYKYIILLLFSFFLLFSKDEQGRVHQAITLNLELQRFTVILLILMIIVFTFRAFDDIWFDIIALLLIIRVVFSLTSIINYNGTLIEFVEAGFFQLIFLTMVYIMTININDNDIEKNIIWIFKIISLILVMQISYVFIDAILMGVQLSSIKSMINIPMGRSNFVAMMVAFLLIFGSINYDRSFKNFILLFLLFISLLISSSDGAILSIVFIVVIYINNNSPMRLMFRVLSFTLLAYLLVVILIPLEIVPNIQLTPNTFLERVRRIFSGNISDASSGRIALFIEFVDGISKHPIFGNGFYKPFINIQGTSHNFILQEAYNSGIVTATIYLLTLSISMIKMKKYSISDNFIKSSYYATLYIVIHSLIEPGLLGYRIGFYFWVLIGVCMLKIRRIKRIENVNSYHNS